MRFEMTANTKRKTLILLGVVILITMMVAANLPQLEFQPGMPLPRLENGQVVAVPIEEDQAVSISAPKFILVFIALILAGATLYSMVQRFRGADWKFIAAVLRPILIVSLVIGGLVFLIMLLPASGSYTPVEIPVLTPQAVVTSPPGSAPPPPLVWLVGIGLFVISVLVLVWITRPSHQASPMDLVGREAEKARQALKTGVHLKDVIIQCYIQMSLALKQEQGIERKDFMTTGEFENLLETAGVPHEPIHQLTRLFEAVRYGNWQPNPVDEQLAIQCLEAIMIYSRDARGMR